MSKKAEARRQTARFENRRTDIVSKIPFGYDYLLHMILPSGTALIGFVLSILLMTQFSWWMPLAFAGMFFVFFGFEWYFHKNILHQRFPFIESIYEKHELAHHLIFVDQDMAIRDKREIYYVLIPYLAFILAFTIVVFPVAFIIGWFSWNLAMLYLAAAFLFYLTYEWLHFAYHMPQTDGIPVFRLLKKHHEIHHNTRNMKRYNFNVTVPVFDAIMGTRFKSK
jgi:hypothetical protein